MAGTRSSHLRAALLSALALCCVVPASSDFTQQDSPLRGQGVPGPNVSQGIYFNAFLDRLLNVDEQNYRFNAVMYFYVTWYSDTDTAMWFRNNVGRNCADPARADYAQYCGDLKGLCRDLRNLTAGVNATAAAGIDKMLSAEAGIPVAAMCESFTADFKPTKTDCVRLCSNSYETQDCCDGIFIPDFQLANVYETAQDYTHHYTVTPQINPKKESFGAFMWTSQIHAEFYTPMDFAKFPWDKQDLLIEIRYVHNRDDLNTTSRLLPSAAGVLNLRPETHGDDSSGWHVDSVELEPYAVADPARQLRGRLSPPNPHDPVPLFSTRPGADGRQVVTGIEPVFNDRLNPGNNLLVRITVSRYWRYYVVNTLIPIILTGLLGFTVFLVPSNDIEKRLTLLVTLFLALTAVQFVISAELPDSSYILKSQALVLVGYAFLLAIALEAWLVSHISLLHETTTKLQRQTSAYRKHWKRQAAAAAAVAKADLLPQALQQRRSPLGRPPGLQHAPADAGKGAKGSRASDSGEDLESPRVPSQLQLNTGATDICALLQAQRSASAPLPPQGCGAPDGSSDSSGSGSSRTNSSRGGGNGGGRSRKPPSAWRSRRHPRPYARIKFVLRPARDDPHYAEWLAQTVDRWACIFLLVAYVTTTTVLLAV